MAADSEREEDDPEKIVLGNGETLAERVERIDPDSLDEKESTTTDELREKFDL